MERHSKFHGSSPHQAVNPLHFAVTTIGKNVPVTTNQITSPFPGHGTGSS
jgi:hypothetical protein